MIKYIASFEKLRKRAALSIAILIVITVVFITVMTNFVNELNRQVDDLTGFEAERVEEFLENSLERDRAFLRLWQNDWESYILINDGRMTEEQLINSFIQRRLAVVRDISTASVVLFIKHGNEIIFLDYGDERYENYHDILTNLNIDTPPSYQQVILNDPDFIGRFGSGDRIFLTGVTLSLDEADSLYLFVGFHEQIMYETFVNTLDLDLAYSIKDNAQLVLYVSIVFLFAIIIYGLVLIFLIRWFIYKTMIWFAKIHPFGEIAIKKGYLTEEQVEDCLVKQEDEFGKVKRN
jgi:hypothetical protein